MAEGLGRERWAHTSVLCALVANANRDPKKGRAYRPRDFDPYAREHRRRVVASGQDLREIREALEARRSE
jgi:hypothetical protein